MTFLSEDAMMESPVRWPGGPGLARVLAIGQWSGDVSYHTRRVARSLPSAEAPAALRLAIGGLLVGRLPGRSPNPSSDRVPSPGGG